MPSTREDLYAALGVSASASTAEIALAFRARAKELHPDLHPGDAAVAERFKRLTSAYRVLGRADARAAYDARRNGRPSSPAPAAPAAPRAVAHQPVFRTPGRARAAVWTGVLLVVLGIAAAGALVALPTGDIAKTITLWIVVVKLVVCGGLLVGYGAWRLGRLRADAFATAR